MKHLQRTPHSRTGVTTQDLKVEFGAGSFSKLKYETTVPKGTSVHLLVGGSTRWVVADLDFIDDKRSLMFDAADVYGITIPEEQIEGIQPVERSNSQDRPRFA